MLFNDIVATSANLSGTASRLSKIALLAECIGRLAPDEVVIAIHYLSGILRQGRIGIGFSKLMSMDQPCAEHPDLTVSEVDATLSRIAEVAGAGSTARKRELLATLFARATPEEQGFLIRLLMGELRQGAQEGVMLEAVARAAQVPVEAVRRATMFSGNLALAAASALSEGVAGLRRISVTLFQPVSPMLAQPATDAADALKRLGEAAFEWKLDGARIQLHKLGSVVRIYTRNLNEVTPAVPELVEQAASIRADSAILDGEALALRPDRSPYPFQATMSRFGRKLDVTARRRLLPLTPFFFDCLYFNGESLIDEPESERFRVLSRMVPGQFLIPRMVSSVPHEVAEFFASILKLGHEGMMAKSLSTPYEAGRRGYAWLKIKPVQTLDLVVLAAEWGHGRRSGLLSNLHLGARDAERGGYVMLGKTFKGMTDAMLAWQTKRLLELEVSRDAWTVYVRPELMVEVGFSDIQASPRYPGGFALRFARVKRYRPDKLPDQADTLVTVQELFRRQNG